MVIVGNDVVGAVAVVVVDDTRSAAATASAAVESLSLLFIAAIAGGVNADVVNFATAVAINVDDAESLITIR